MNAGEIGGCFSYRITQRSRPVGLGFGDREGVGSSNSTRIGRRHRRSKNTDARLSIIHFVHIGTALSR
jgi:hypothetical protein